MESLQDRLWLVNQLTHVLDIKLSTDLIQKILPALVWQNTPITIHRWPNQHSQEFRTVAGAHVICSGLWDSVNSPCGKFWNFPNMLNGFVNGGVFFGLQGGGDSIRAISTPCTFAEKDGQYILSIDQLYEVEIFIGDIIYNLANLPAELLIEIIRAHYPNKPTRQPAAINLTIEFGEGQITAVNKIGTINFAHIYLPKTISRAAADYIKTIIENGWAVIPQGLTLTTIINLIFDMKFIGLEF